jgi:hypothetical protein
MVRHFNFCLLGSHSWVGATTDNGKRAYLPSKQFTLKATVTAVGARFVVVATHCVATN